MIKSSTAAGIPRRLLLLLSHTHTYDLVVFLSLSIPLGRSVDRTVFAVINGHLSLSLFRSALDRSGVLQKTVVRNVRSDRHECLAAAMSSAGVRVDNHQFIFHKVPDRRTEEDHVLKELPELNRGVLITEQARRNVW